MKLSKSFFATLFCVLISTFLRSQCVTCIGTTSASIGQNNTIGSTINSAFIAGRNSTITSNYSAVIGSSSNNKSMYSYITGYFSNIEVGCASSYILGEHCTINNTYSMLLGYNLKTSTANSFAIGYGNVGNELTTTVPYSLIVGFKSKYPTLFVGPTSTDENCQSGKVGIGNITNPLAKLHIKGDIIEDASLLLEATGIDKAAAIVLSGSKNYIGTSSEVSPLAFLTGGDYTRMVITAKTGMVGIGDFSKSEPEGKLHIKALDDEDATLIIESSTTSKISGLLFKNSPGNIATTDAQPINFYTGSTTLRMKIAPNGNVGIGTDAPNKTLTVQGSSQFNGDIYVMSSNLYIEGTVQAKKFRAVIDPLPDYVFSKKYKLLPLSEVKRYIDQYSHLPNVPSAQEAALNGIELGEFNATLLKKIEELTLYILDQEERIKQLETSITQNK
jgi:hypothetical protein